MGEVWLASRADEGASRQFAIKVVRNAIADPREQSRLRRERRLLARLEHPLVAGLLDAGETPAGAPYFVMEYVDGDPLDVACDQRGLGLRARAELVRDVCEAVAAAHRQLVVHCDLKPSNILVNRNGTPKLLDFGIARLLGGDGTSTGTRTLTSLELTPDYASPELLRGEPIGVETDVYSLGELLFLLCTGHHSVDLEGTTGFERRRRLIETPARPAHSVVDADHATRLSTSLQHLRRELRGDLGAILAKALAGDPSDRYAGAGQFAADLDAYLAGETIVARRPSAAVRVWRWARRRRATALIAGLTITTLAAWMTFAGLEYQVAREQRDSSRALEESARDRAAAANRAFDASRRLADVQRLANLQREIDQLWPLQESLVAGMDAWIERAEELVGRRHEYSKALQELPPAPAEVALLPDVVEAAWRRDLLQRLLDGIETLTKPDPIVQGTLAEMHNRRHMAATRTERSVTGYSEEWSSVADDIDLSGRYEILDLPPQPGLVPLGLAPESDLLEFAVLDTGEIPQRDPGTEELQIDELSAIVLVLVPRGDNPRPAQKNRVGPLLFSKYEVTQAQWFRWTGERPSAYVSGLPTVENSDLHPVERVSYDEAESVFHRFGLRHPDEDEWELAARAGAKTKWWCGSTKESISEQNAGNVCDQYALQHGPGTFGYHEAWNDGFVVHAPIGSFTSNDFGIHDTIGNVEEWCRQLVFDDFPDSPGVATSTQAAVGGSFQSSTEHAVEHESMPRDGAVPYLGIRPVWAGEID